MAAGGGGEGFVIPARVVVTVEGLSQVKSQLEAFVAASKGAEKLGQRPVDPATGGQATVEKMRQETGAQLNAVRQAAALSRQELGRTDITAKRRREIEAEIKTWQRLEQQVLKTSRAGRTEAGKVLPPIYPQGELRFPSVGAAGKYPVQPPAPRAMPPIPQPRRVATDAAVDMPVVRRRAPRIATDAAVDMPVVRRRPAEVAVEMPRPRRSGETSDQADARRAAGAQVADRQRVADQKLAFQTEMRTESGQKLIQAETALAVQEAELRAMSAQMLSTDRKLLEAKALEANAHQEQSQRIAMLRAGKDPGNLQGAELAAAAALTQRAQADRMRALMARKAGEDEINAAAALRLEESKYRLAVRKRERELINQAVKQGDPSVTRGTWFQQLQARLNPVSNKLPEEFLTGRQFIGQKFQTTVGFAASGAALGLATAAVSEMFRDATELEKTFVGLRNQMDGIGKVDSFAKVRDDLRGVAAETGHTTNELAGFYSRLLGLSGDPAKAMTDTAAAAKLMTVTGLDAKSVLTSLVPIQKAYTVSAEEIGDEVVAMGEKFGISEDALTEFLGKTAAVGKNAGFSLHEITVIGANMANSLGKPISSGAESVNKMMTQIEENADKIFAILQTNPATEGAIPQMISQMGAGDTSGALITLLKASQQFTATQRNALLKNVVSRREAEEFNAMFTNADQILQQLGDRQDGAGDSAGRLNKRFEELSKTVSVTFAQIRSAFEGIGDSLFRAGLADFLTTLGTALGFIVGTVGAVVAVFAKLNETLKVGSINILSTVAKIGAVAVTLVKFYEWFAKSKLVSALGSKTEAAADTESIAVKQQETAVTNEAAAANTRLTQTKLASAEASRVQTTAAAGVPFAQVTGAGAAAATAAPAVGGAGSAAAANAAAAAAAGTMLPGGLRRGANLAEATRFAAIENAAARKTVESTAKVEVERAAQAASIRRVTNAETASALTTRFRSKEQMKFVDRSLKRTTGQPGIWGGSVPGSVPGKTIGSYSAAQQGLNAAAQYRLDFDRRAALRAGLFQEDPWAAARRAAQRAGRVSAADEALRVSRLLPPPITPNISPGLLAQASKLAKDAGPSRLSYLKQQLAQGYDMRRRGYDAQFQEMAQAGTLGAPSFWTKATAGASTTAFKSAKADAFMGASGGVQGMWGWRAAIGIAGAAAVKTAYDGQVEEIKAQAEKYKSSLRTYTSEEIKARPRYEKTFESSMYASIFGQPSVPDLEQEEQAFVATREARAAIGFKTRPEPVRSAAEKSKINIQDEQKKATTAMVAQFTGEQRQGLLEFLRKQKPEDVDKAIQAGIVKGNKIDTRALVAADMSTENLQRFYTAQQDQETVFSGALAAWTQGAVGSVEGAKGLADAQARLSQQAAAASALIEGKSIDQYFADTDEGYKGVEQLQREFESGAINQAEYIQGLERNLSVIRQKATALRGSEGGTRAAELQAETEKIIREFREENIRRVEELATSLRAMGSTRPKAVTAEGHAAQLLKMSVKARVAELPALMNEEMAAAEESWGKIANTEDRIKAMNEGVKFSATATQTWHMASVETDSKANQAIKDIAATLGLNYDTVAQAITKIATDQGISMKDAAAQYLDSQIDKQKKGINTAKAIGSQMYEGLYTRRVKALEENRGGLIAAFGDLPDIPSTIPEGDQQAITGINERAKSRQAKAKIAAAYAGGDSLKTAAINAREANAAYADMIKRKGLGGATDDDVDEAFASKVAADKSQSDAFFDYQQLIRNRQVILANGDPVAENAAQMTMALASLSRAQGAGDLSKAEQASQEIIRLQQQAGENQLNIARARMTLAESLVSEDPLEMAKKSLEQAELELANAKGDMDRYLKQAGVNTAQKGLANAVSDGIAAQAQLAISLATLRDDPVEAARLTLLEAQRQLDRAKAKNITDPSVLSPLEDQIAQATKAAYLAPITKQVEDLDFLYNMEQISLQQYISGLQVLMQKYNVNSREYKDMAQRIHSLKKQSEQDFQFNLPSTLGLPTLYEARRTNQSGQMGMGYQDNRNISMIVNVNGAQDPITITNQIVGALTAVSGMTSTPFMGVGV